MSSTAAAWKDTVNHIPKRFGLAHSEQTLALVRRLIPPRQVNHGRQVEFDQVVLIDRGMRAHILRINGFEMYVPSSIVTFYDNAQNVIPGWTGKVCVNARWAQNVGLL